MIVSEGLVLKASESKYNDPGLRWVKLKVCRLWCPGPLANSWTRETLSRESVTVSIWRFWQSAGTRNARGS